MSILGFSDPAIEAFFFTGNVPSGAGWASVRRVAARKLDIVDYHRG